MATMNLSICDLCNAIRKDGLPHKLSIKEKGTKGGANVKAEICQVCFDDISSRIESEVSFEEINKRQPTRPNQTHARPTGPLETIDEGMTIAPSAMDYRPGSNSPPQGCSHDQKSYEPPIFTCRTCGHKWEEAP